MSNETTQLPVGASRSRTHRTLTAFVREWLARTRDALVYSSAYLVLVGMAEVLTATFALSLPLTPAPLVIGLVTFAVYTGDRVADADADDATNPGQAAFARRHARVLSVLTAAAYGLAIALAVLGGPLALGVTLLPGVAWIGYVADPLHGVGLGVRRLKDVFLVNSAVVSLAWAVTAVCLPLGFAGAPVTPATLAVFGYLLLATFVNAEIPNVRDREGDAAAGVTTLPVVVGVARTRRICYVLDAGVAAFVAYAGATGRFSVALTVAALCGVGFALAVASRVGRTDRPDRLAIVCDVQHVIVFSLLVAFGALA